jgi:hypothetical protein
MELFTHGDMNLIVHFVNTYLNKKMTDLNLKISYPQKEVIINELAAKIVSDLSNKIVEIKQSNRLIP